MLYFKIVKILITSSSRKIPLIRAVKLAALKVNPKSVIIAGDSIDAVISKSYMDNFWLMPESLDKNLKLLIDGCIDRKINIIIPTRDGELFFWSKNLKKFRDVGIQIIVSSFEAIKICLDKQLFFEFGNNNNLPFITTSLSIDKLSSIRSLVVKERHGSSSKEIGINLDFMAAKRYAKNLNEPIFQPYVVGEEFSADAWVDNDNLVKGIVLRKRMLVENGESVITETFQDKAIELLIEKVLFLLKLKGPVMIQGIIDDQMMIHIIECNARFGGASTCSISAGLDSFYWSILEAYGYDLAQYPFAQDFNTIRQIRIPFDIYQ